MSITLLVVDGLMILHTVVDLCVIGCSPCVPAIRWANNLAPCFSSIIYSPYWHHRIGYTRPWYYMANNYPNMENYSSSEHKDIACISISPRWYDLSEHKRELSSNCWLLVLGTIYFLFVFYSSLHKAVNSDRNLSTILGLNIFTLVFILPFSRGIGSSSVSTWSLICSSEHNTIISVLESGIMGSLWTVFVSPFVTFSILLGAMKW